MLKKLTFAVISTIFCAGAVFAQTTQNSDTVMILPFENTSQKPEFNWVGESFADSLSDLLKVPALNVVTNDERKIVQQQLRIPLTNLPSLATSLKLAQKTNATLLVTGKYNIIPAQGETAATLNVTAKIIRVNEGRFLSEEFSDGSKKTREINLNDALGNLQTVEGQVAYRVLYFRYGNEVPFSQDYFIEAANKIPARAFEAYIKGLLTSDNEARENYFKNAVRLYAEEDKTKGQTYADAALELGHFYLNQRQNQNAVDYFSRASNEIRRCQDEAKSNKKISQCNEQIDAEAAFYTGLIQWQQNNYEQALAVLRPLAEVLKLTSVYNTIGAIAVQSSRVEKKDKQKSAALLNQGIELLKKAADSSPDEKNAQFNYAMALFLNDSYAEAVTQLKLVALDNPNDGETYYLLAKTLDALKDASAAEMDNKARRFLTENNKYANLETEWKRSKTINNIGLRVVQPPRKDFVSVVKKQLVPMTPTLNETDALLEQARTFYKNGADDNAMEILLRFQASEPMNAENYLIQGKIYLRRGDLDKAIGFFRTALFWDVHLIDAHIALGKIYLQKNDCLQAKNYTASATAIDAENQEVVALQRNTEKCSTK